MPHTNLIKFWAGAATEVSPGVFQCQMNGQTLSAVKGIALKTAVFSNNVYNIKDGENDVVYFRINALPQNYVVVPAGYYSAPGLAGVIEALIQTQLTSDVPGAVISLTFNAVSAKYESEVTGATFAWDNEAALAPPSMGTTLGLAVGAGAITPDGTPFLFPSLVQLQGLSHATISIRSHATNTFLNVSAEQARFTNNVSTIPVNAPFGGLVNYTQPNTEQAYCDFMSVEDLRAVQISIRDEYGVGIPGQAPYLLVEFVVWRSH